MSEISADFVRMPLRPDITTPEGQVIRAAPGRARSYEEAVQTTIAKRALVGMSFQYFSQEFSLNDSNPTPELKGAYRTAALEVHRGRGWEGIVAHGLKGAPFFYGYDRLGNVGPEVLDVSELSSIATIVAGAGLSAIPVFTETGAFAPPPVGVLIPTDNRSLSVRFRVRNPFLSRIVVRLRNASTASDGGEFGYVKMWLSRGIGPATEQLITPAPGAVAFHSGGSESEAISPVVRIPIRQIKSLFQDFQFPLLAIFQTVAAGFPAPGEEDTYQLNLQADDRLRVEAEVVTAVVNVDPIPDIVVPRFRVFTFGAAPAAGGGGGPGPAGSTYTSAAVYAKYYAQRSLNPGAAAPPASLFALPDGTLAAAVLLPAPLQGPAPVPPPPGDAGTDFTSQIGAGSSSVDFWEVLRKPLALMRGQTKARQTFVVTGAGTLTAITAAILRNTGAGTAVVATKTFAALALVAGTYQFAFYPELAVNAVFLANEAFGYRVSWTHAGAGQTDLRHTRSTDETHLEASIIA